MARSDENTVFCSFRMYLSNPQHLRIAKALKQLERDKTKSKNQFIADAVEYYLDHQDAAKNGQDYITRNELDSMKLGLREEILTILRLEFMRAYHPYVAAPLPEQPMREQTKEEKPDDTIMDLVSDWD